MSNTNKIFVERLAIPVGNNENGYVNNIQIKGNKERLDKIKAIVYQQELI